MQGINMRIFAYISILVVVVASAIGIYFYSPNQQIIKGNIFGTYYTIKIRTAKPDKNISAEIASVLDKVNRSMSVFDETSEISQINRSNKGIDIPLSQDMAEVMAAAAKVNRQSQGWFDPTLGKLIDLWGFGAGDMKNPSSQEITQALKTSGFDKLVFSKDFKQLRKKDSATYINLSAIAKGYGVDKVAELLSSKGYHDYMIEIGGEIKVGGSRSDQGDSWNIGINRPQSGAYDNVMVVSISNLAVATSGNYRNFYKQDGNILAHTISYKTGRPIQTDALSVSVFHDSCMYADAYATAIMAMGVEEGLAFANKYDLKVIIFDNNLKPNLSSAAKAIFEE